MTTPTLYIFGEMVFPDDDTATVYHAGDYAWLADDHEADHYADDMGFDAYIAPEVTGRTIRWENSNTNHLLYERGDESLGCIICDYRTDGKRIIPKHYGRGYDHQ